MVFVHGGGLTLAADASPSTRERTPGRITVATSTHAPAPAAQAGGTTAEGPSPAP